MLRYGNDISVRISHLSATDFIHTVIGIQAAASMTA